MAIDPTFYRTAADAIAAPPEELAYVVALDGDRKKNDAVVVVDIKPSSSTYGQVVGWTDVQCGDELHHFGWNACSSSFKHAGCGAMDGVQRRYLLVPGIRSSNLYVLDVGPDPRKPKLVKTIDAKSLSEKAGYSRPHTVHCGPQGVFLTCLGGPIGDDDARGGIALLDPKTFEVVRAWETDHGPQHFHYDAWWHLNAKVLISSEWGSPSMIEGGLVMDDLLANRYGHSVHFWDLDKGRHEQRIDLGEDQQMVLEVRPSHDPHATWGFVGVAISTKDLSGSVFYWFLDSNDHQWKAQKVISIPAEPAHESLLPPILKRFGAVPPIVTDIDLSVDDKFLYVACWATGEVKQYDVSEPLHPVEVGSIRLGGVVDKKPHPGRPGLSIGGGPQMLEISRDGRRVYFTSSLYSSWDDQIYPDGVGAWMAKLSVDPNGGIEIDEDFFPNGDDFRGLRVHQIRLQGGDASTDSYCYR